MISPQNTHVGYWLRTVSNHVSEAFTRRLEVEDVTIAEWNALSEIWAAKEIMPSKLALTVGMTRGGMSKLIDRLIEKGLVDRAEGLTDRRYQTLTLSPIGKSLVPRLAQQAEDNEDEFFGHLSQRQRAELIELLQNVIEDPV